MGKIIVVDTASMNVTNVNFYKDSIKQMMVKMIEANKKLSEIGLAKPKKKRSYQRRQKSYFGKF